MRSLCTALLALALLSAPAAAQLYSAASGQTPTETCVPWIRTLDSVVPAPTVSGGLLTLSTAACPERVGYTLRDPVISMPATVWIEARLRVLSGGTCTTVRRTVTIAISPVPDEGQLIHIGPGEVIMSNSSNGPGTEYVSAQHSLDTSVFHTYRLTVFPNGVSQVEVDGVVVMTSAITYNPSNHGALPRITWHQGSIFSWGTAEWEYVDSNVTHELGCDIVQAAPGAPITICNRGMIPGNEYVNLFNLELCPGGPGTGPLLGLCATTAAAQNALLSQFLAAGTPPFRFIAPSTHPAWGPYPSFPVTVDVLCLDITGGVLNATSAVTRQTIL